MLTVKDMIRNQVKFGDMLIQSYRRRSQRCRSARAKRAGRESYRLANGASHLQRETYPSGPRPRRNGRCRKDSPKPTKRRTPPATIPSSFSTKAEYLRLHGLMLEAIEAALDKTPDTALEEPGPESMREYAPTKAAVVHAFRKPSRHARRPVRADPPETRESAAVLRKRRHLNNGNYRAKLALTVKAILSA